MNQDQQLRERCAEILNWHKTGVLTGNALRDYATAKYGDKHDALQCAEADTAREAFAVLTATKKAEPSQGAVEHPYPHPLSDFQEGQWWTKELDELVRGPLATSDQKRSVAVVRHMLKSAAVTLEASAQREQHVNFDEWFATTDGNPSFQDCFTAGLSAQREQPAGSKPGPQAQAEPCPDSRMDIHACKNRHQCWEPCGELGHSMDHARPASAETQQASNAAIGLPQAQAREPQDGRCEHHACLYPACECESEPQAQVEELIKLGLWDSQWVNIVNDQALLGMDKEDAIHHVIKMVERNCIKNAHKALVKKDAALKACVEALEKSEEIIKELGGSPDESSSAAIAQGQEALK